MLYNKRVVIMILFRLPTPASLATASLSSSSHTMTSTKSQQNNNAHSSVIQNPATHKKGHQSAKDGQHHKGGQLPVAPPSNAVFLSSMQETINRVANGGGYSLKLLHIIEYKFHQWYYVTLINLEKNSILKSNMSATYLQQMSEIIHFI